MYSLINTQQDQCLLKVNQCSIVVYREKTYKFLFAGKYFAHFDVSQLNGFIGDGIFLKTDPVIHLFDA